MKLLKWNTAASTPEPGDQQHFFYLPDRKCISIFHCTVPSNQERIMYHLLHIKKVPEK